MKKGVKVGGGGGMEEEVNVWGKGECVVGGEGEVCGTTIIIRGATTLLVAIATPVVTCCSASEVSQFIPITAYATWQPRSVDR